MKIRKKYLFYALAFSSAIIVALNSGIDVIAKSYIDDPWALGMSCFIAGVIISLLFTLLLSIPRKGKSIGSILLDPSFQRIRFPKKKEIIYHLLSGFGNAILTIGYFIVLSILGDPSVVLPFGQMVILYLVVIESITEKDVPTLVEIQSSIIVTFGAILGSISLSGSINIQALIIVFGVINPGWVLLSIYQRKLKMMKINEKTNDSINIRLWNVIFACLFTGIIVLIIDTINGSSIFFEGIRVTIEYFHWMAVIGIGTFLSFVFYIRALGIGKASVTQAVKSSVIIFSIPVSIALSYIGLVDPITTDPVLLIIKFIGIVLMILGIMSFALTLTKAYIFIRINTGYPIEETMNKIWNIKGVNRVTATAGSYDYIVKIRTRTLVKGYEKIIRKLEEIDAIKEYKWESVLKEWEKI